MHINNHKILFLSMSNLMGGAEGVLLMAAAAVNGSVIFLKNAKGPKVVIPEGVKSKCLTNGNMLHAFIKLPSALNKYDDDVVLLSTHAQLNAYLGFLKRIGWIKNRLIARESTSIFTRFNGIKKSLYHLLYRLGYPAINLIVCQTNEMKEQLLAYNNFISADKVIVNSNPINLNKIANHSQLLPIDFDSKVEYVCAAGRLIPEKGFDILIKAFADVHQSYPKLKLFIFGEGPEEVKLKQLIRDEKLEHVISLKGFSSNLIAYYKHAKVCVVSSKKEGFPNVLLEMMAVNPRVVTTLCAGGIDQIPVVLKVVPDNAIALGAMLMKALTINEEKISYQVEDYLKERTPEIFIHFILSKLEALQVDKQVALI